MNFTYFIAKRLQKAKDDGRKISKPIVRIAILSIAISLAVNLITIAVVTGFQIEVRNKVAGFGSHIQILKSGEYSTFEGEPIIKDTNFEKLLLANNKIDYLQSFAYKPALLQAKLDTVWYHINGIDTFQLEQEIQGVMVKGVDKDYHWNFFESNLVEGRLPVYTDTLKSDEILVSKKIANNLNLKLNERTRAFFVDNKAIKRMFTVVGIFSSGLEELDKELIIADIHQVQDLNDWGIQTSIRISDTLFHDKILVNANVKGGNGNYKYNWGKEYEPYGSFVLDQVKDTVIELIVSDYWMEISRKEEDSSIPDTAYLTIDVINPQNLEITPKINAFGELEKEYLDKYGLQFNILCENGVVLMVSYKDGKGSSNQYIGGYEISVKDWNNLHVTVDEIRQKLMTVDQLNNDNKKELLINKYNVRSIKQDREEIFMWLDFLDLNVYIILVLMLIIGIINMGSGLLVLIITKTNFIGLFKALGSSNWNIRKVFLYQVLFLILKGLFIGNLVGLGFIFCQKYFNIIPLNSEIYYLSAVPINISFWHIILLNIGTLVVCVLALILPSYVITKISPIKAMKLK